MEGERLRVDVGTRDADPLSTEHLRRVTTLLGTYERLLDDVMDGITPGFAVASDDSRVWHSVTPSLRNPGWLQVTSFLGSEALGDRQYEDVASALMGECWPDHATVRVAGPDRAATRDARGRSR